MQIVDGIPRIKWTKAEVKIMNIIENLEYVVIDKFSYEWPDLDTIRKAIPSQCAIKGDYSIGLFHNCHILIRLSLMEDFINLISKRAYYINCNEGYSYLMRP